MTCTDEGYIKGYEIDIAKESGRGKDAAFRAIVGYFDRR